MAGQKGMKWSPYKLKKRRLLRDLQKVYGRLKDQAVFPVDDENCQIIKDALEFFQVFLHFFFLHGKMQTKQSLKILKNYLILY